MKNKLTVTQLALGNLKSRKKQYAIMIIGIILAMIFSSSVILFASSAMETHKENTKRDYGLENGIVTSQKLTDEDYQQALKDGYITNYGYIHTVGFAYPNDNEEYLGASVAWFDDKAWDMYYLPILEGNYPTAENEIAIEKTNLNYLGYKDAKIGDTIKLKFEIQNSNGKVVDKEYKLVGIMRDRNIHLSEGQGVGNIPDKIVPALYVAQGTKVDIGGKEDKYALYQSDFSKEFQVPGEESPTDKFAAPYTYFSYITNDDCELRSWGYSKLNSPNPSFDSLFNGGTYISIIILALIFASCIAIINAFNTNLKERKKQIGLFRAVGTTRRQIINIFGREAFIISLIATPISVAVSYLIVKVVINIFSKEAIMSKSLWALLLAAVVNVVVVMLAALVPLVIASKTSPMQAIRNVNVARKAKNKKIKSKKQFNVSSHIAKRNTKFYKGSTIAVSVMLIVTICFSCIAFSFVSYTSKNLYTHKHDYLFSCYSVSEDEGLNETDFRAIESLPYVEKAYGEKEIECEVECDKLDNFVRVVDSNRYESNANHDWRNPSSAKEALEWMMENPDKSYYEKKDIIGFDKEMFKSRLCSFDPEIIRSATKNVDMEGSINYDKLASGEEVILVVPKKAEFHLLIGRNVYGSMTVCDENIGKSTVRYTKVFDGESNYKVGDELTFATCHEIYDENTDTTNYKLRSKNTVKIGAIIRPNSLTYQKNGIAVGDTAIITSNQGINKLVSGIEYHSVDFDVLCNLNDETDQQVKDDVSKYNEKYGGWLLSRYEEENRQVEDNRRMLTAIIILIIIGFIICISIVNNSITAHIRENKRVIGTLRAVGADKSDLVKSYVHQMLSMFGWGTGIGYGLFFVTFAILKLVESKTFEFKAELDFNPWITIVMTVLSFSICAINVYVKIKKEMKNSIVENIREL